MLKEAARISSRGRTPRSGHPYLPAFRPRERDHAACIAHRLIRLLAGGRRLEFAFHRVYRRLPGESPTLTRESIQKDQKLPHQAYLSRMNTRLDPSEEAAMAAA